GRRRRCGRGARLPDQARALRRGEPRQPRLARPRPPGEGLHARPRRARARRVPRRGARAAPGGLRAPRPLDAGERGAARDARVVVFALTLLAKIFFNVHAYHYGFALAMPATLLVVVALVGWAPAAITARGGCGALFRAVALACLLVAALTHLAVSGRRFAAKIHRVGGGADALLADARGPVVEAALGALARQAAAGQSLAVLPEGVMLNYLSRRAS